MVRDSCALVVGDGASVDALVEAVMEEIVTGGDSSNTSRHLTSDDFCQSLVEFLGEIVFDIGTVAVADRHSRSNANTFVYQFAHRPAYVSHPPWIVADHGNEIPFIFGSVINNQKEPHLVNDEDVQMCLQMMSYWANFATSGNPNGGGLVHWPRYGETTKEHLIIKLSAESGSHLKREHMEFWRRHVPWMFA
jgi:carboxylesterase type B